ncbi:hypothetical protein WA026_005709 [Henosepilachna vigintioctopunctata]|uniref:Uncharacterized protein n=1 Tax=Henosepilachna vigintioctopunctata TaxID=420089 RepID=A0AAW1U417_9CUCU
MSNSLRRESYKVIVLSVQICIYPYSAALLAAVTKNSPPPRPVQMRETASGHPCLVLGFIYHHLTPSNYVFCSTSLDMLFSSPYEEICDKAKCLYEGDFNEKYYVANIEEN